MAPVAHWESLKEKALVNFLFENHSESGDAGNFKPKTYQATLSSIALFYICGTPKSVKTLQNKWSAVHGVFYILPIELCSNANYIHHVC